jgi:hypothetical protein
MQADMAALFDARAALPMELRASLDLLYELLAGDRGVMRTSIIGEPSLASALARYGTIKSDSERATILGVSAHQISETIARDQPERIIVLGSGRLAHLTRPLRRNRTLVPRVPGDRWWEDRGYQRMRSIKVQGTGSLFWSACDRVLRRLNQVHLADRCRVAMLRTLVAAHWRFVPSTLCIQQYRRAT